MKCAYNKTYERTEFEKETTYDEYGERTPLTEEEREALRKHWIEECGEIQDPLIEYERMHGKNFNPKPLTGPDFLKFVAVGLLIAREYGIEL